MKVLCAYGIRDDYFDSEGAVMVEVNKLSQVEKAFDQRMTSLNHKKAFAPRKIDGWYMRWWLPEYLAFGKLKVVENAETENFSRPNNIRPSKTF